jgi:ATP phosphoribosyltransferase regulatory subunit
MDLRELARLLPIAGRKRSIRAPWSRDPSLREKISELRKAGEVVIQNMPGHENDQEEFDCDRAIVQDGTSWVVKPLG